ncbi:hypothetical protein DL96DRAFT_1695315 [Flagelloscypha sp. PMI_526]|nr:hypothetical protein DL96DRAFT_1695315 [Flagelloscypha sp. PMI_526]
MSGFIDTLRADRLVTVAYHLNVYNGARKFFTLAMLVVGPVLVVINAPFGRFSPKNSIFAVDGIKSWMIMEIVSPLGLLATFFMSPLSVSPENPKNYAQLTLAASIISPLRTPSRSKSHLIVPLAAVIFNGVNGPMMGSYLSSRTAQDFLATAFTRSSFWIGVGLWAVGLAGNIIHDEMLYDIRRKAQSKKKDGTANGHSNGHSNGHANGGTTGNKEHYAIPHGLLYEYISYPNYFCEWVEWFGFAIAASPCPLDLVWAGLKSVFDVTAPLDSFAPLLTPPWIFLLAELMTMFPRAYKGHLWYREHFGERYPGEQKNSDSFRVIVESSRA